MDDELERRRRTAFSDDASRVRRARHFEVMLGDAASRRKSARDDAGSFQERYVRWIRPLLMLTQRCLVVEKQQGSVRPVKLYEEWERAGARPEEWRAHRFRQSAGQLEIEMRPDVIEDALFWWWLLPGLAPYWTVLLTAVERFDAGPYFSVVENPTCIRNRFAGPSRHVLELAKRSTARDRYVAFIIQPRHPSLSVVASGAEIVRLFEVAVAHARHT